MSSWLDNVKAIKQSFNTFAWLSIAWLFFSIHKTQVVKRSARGEVIKSTIDREYIRHCMSCSYPTATGFGAR